MLTADFITPIVDDAVDFGAIAAANALSDIYAMGAQPLLALNLVGFPRDQLELDVLTEILSAGAAVVHQAGALTVGGHTIDDPELKYGLSLVGRVHPDKVVRNRGGRPGDRLYLTKPLGVGIISTAAKQDRLDPTLLDLAVAQMRQTNRAAAEAMTQVGVDAATDVTGFGLLGHLGELTAASGVAAMLESAAVPVLDGVLELAREGVVPSGTRRNLAAAMDRVQWPPGIEEARQLVLADAQTSGGLLVAVSEEREAGLDQAMTSAGVEARRIGTLEAGEAGTITVV